MSKAVTTMTTDTQPGPWARGAEHAIDQLEHGRLLRDAWVERLGGGLRAECLRVALASGMTDAAAGRDTPCPISAAEWLWPVLPRLNDCVSDAGWESRVRALLVALRDCGDQITDVGWDRVRRGCLARVVDRAAGCIRSTAPGADRCMRVCVGVAAALRRGASRGELNDLAEEARAAAAAARGTEAWAARAAARVAAEEWAEAAATRWTEAWDEMTDDLIEIIRLEAAGTLEEVAE